MSLCPHCNKALDVGTTANPCDGAYIKKQHQFVTFWEELLYSRHSVILSKQEIIMKALYVLNDQAEKWDRELVKNKIGDAKVTELLQLVRGTAVIKRSLHISFIQELLVSHEFTVSAFLNLVVPDKFKNGIMKRRGGNVEVVCKAPWCSSYGKVDGIIQTNSKNIRLNDKTLSSYYVCKSCGCEYAIECGGQFIERTFFINSFHIIKLRDLARLTWAEREKVLGLKKSRIRRVYAYFYTRNLFLEHRILISSKIDPRKLNFAIQELHAGKSIYEIQHWNGWQNDDEYLLHRYHPKFVHYLFEVNYLTKSTKGFDSSFLEKVHQSCQYLSTKGDMTLSIVAKHLNMSVTTLRSKGGAVVVAVYKDRVGEKVRQEMSRRLKVEIETLFEARPHSYISSKELFGALSLNRNTIRKWYPEVILHANEKRMKHNQAVKLVV